MGYSGNMMKKNDDFRKPCLALLFQYSKTKYVASVIEWAEFNTFEIIVS